METKLKGALGGLVVLDLTRVLAGPFSTMMLADMGAEIIKIEVPEKGDDSRQFGPFKNGESSYFINLNRNKKGMTLNLKKPEGKAVFLDLVKKADVIIENYRPGTMEKLGLGYDELKKINPRLVYGCVSGFGHYGPYSDRAGYDIIGQAMGGLMSTTGWPDGEPTRTGTAMGDVLAGLSVTIGILSAVRYRDVTGIGQKVDVSLVDSVVASLEIINQIYLVNDKIPERIGNRYESVYPYDSFRGSDGSLVIGCGNDKLWKLLCNLMGTPEYIDDERYDRNPKRVAAHKEVKVIVENWTMTKTVDVLIEEMLAAGIPCAPINNIKQVVEDPHIADAREMFVEIDHPKAGKMKITGSHIKLYETMPEVNTPAPTLGEHNQEILKDFLGYDDATIQSLSDQKVI
ncbi:CoA transferase [Fusibacter paucivorans]|uniref:CoA transferase n=1 Tax=Fusibacter paucivorans TaxID=76009 RepID=A0ABS5PKQ0_9FIRM|nr:CoA transferase [Fusibacter paucivorans]MBS7525136.1 CoA transferase [Fusibacter paucivorans]